MRDLVRVLEASFTMTGETWLVMHKRAKTTRRKRPLVDHLNERLCAFVRTRRPVRVGRLARRVTAAAAEAAGSFPLERPGHFGVGGARGASVVRLLIVGSRLLSTRSRH